MNKTIWLSDHNGGQRWKGGTFRAVGKEGGRVASGQAQGDTAFAVLLRSKQFMNPVHLLCSPASVNQVVLNLSKFCLNLSKFWGVLNLSKLCLNFF